MRSTRQPWRRGGLRSKLRSACSRRKTHALSEPPLLSRSSQVAICLASDSHTFIPCTKLPIPDGFQQAFYTYLSSGMSSGHSSLYATVAAIACWMSGQD